MKTRHLFLLLAAMMAAINVNAQTAFGNGLTWTLTDGVLTITTGEGSDGVIPDYASRGSAPWFSSQGDITSIVVGEGVTVIGDYAFYGCTEATSLSLPAGLTTIKQEAFAYCEGLTSIVIPSGVTTVGMDAFTWCKGVTSLSLPASLTSVANNISFSNLTDIRIEDLAAFIRSGIKAFNNTKHKQLYIGTSDEPVTHLVIPEGIDTIYNRTFYYNSFESVSFPSTLKAINKDAFYSNILSSLYFQNAMPPTSNDYIYGFTDRIITFHVPVGCKMNYEEIRPNYNSSWTFVDDMPATQTYTVNDAADDGVTIFSSPATLYEGNTVTITTPEGTYPFSLTVSYTNGDETIEVPVSHGVYGGRIYDGWVFRMPAADVTVRVNTLATIADGIMTVSACPGGNGEVADFMQSYSPDIDDVNSIVIEDGVKAIGKYAFYDINRVAFVEIGADVATIDENSFPFNTEDYIMHCPPFESTQGCYNLRNYRFFVPESMVDDWTAFFTDEWEDAEPTVIGSDLVKHTISFAATDHISIKGASQQLPGLSVEFYAKCDDEFGLKDFSMTTDKGAEPLKVKTKDQLYIDDILYFGFSFTMPDADVTITPEVVPVMVKDATDHVRWFIEPDSTLHVWPVRWYSVGALTFPSNDLYSAIKSIVIHEGVTSIDKKAFFNDFPNVTSISLPSTLEIIEDYAFYGCKNLEKIEIPASVTTIKPYAFTMHQGIEVSFLRDDPSGYSIQAFYERYMWLGFMFVPAEVVDTYNTWAETCGYTFWHVAPLGTKVRTITLAENEHCTFNHYGYETVLPYIYDEDVQFIEIENVERGWQLDRVEAHYLDADSVEQVIQAVTEDEFRTGWTFEMPDADVTVVAVVSPLKPAKLTGNFAELEGNINVQANWDWVEPDEENNWTVFVGQNICIGINTWGSQVVDEKSFTITYLDDDNQPVTILTDHDDGSTEWYFTMPDHPVTFSFSVGYPVEIWLVNERVGNEYLTSKLNGVAVTPSGSGEGTVAAQSGDEMTLTYQARTSKQKILFWSVTDGNGNVIPLGTGNTFTVPKSSVSIFLCTIPNSETIYAITSNSDKVDVYNDNYGYHLSFVNGATNAIAGDPIYLCPRPGYTYTVTSGGQPVALEDDGWRLGFEMPEASVSITATYTAPSGDFGAEGDNLHWTIDENGLLAITGTGAMENFEGISEIPWCDYQDIITAVTIGDDVTNIGDMAFCQLNSLTTATIGTGVTSIGYAAFNNCYYMETINLPAALTSIDDNAFAYCQSLTSIVLPESLTTIGSYVFSGCSDLKSVTLPSTITTIREGMFESCGSLKNITLPATVTTIENAAFSSTGLKSLTLPAALTTIDMWAFSDCWRIVSLTCERTEAPMFSPNALQNFGDYGTLTLPAGATGYEAWIAVLVENKDWTLVQPTAPTLTGDITGDGNVDVSDVTALVSVILGNTTSTPACDITGDGKVDVSDVTALVAIILSSPSAGN